uniref:Uncharacterized protein n=1 Tax=Arundo donax TaxID=35708 RepID=A0A0A8XV02_ARUDO
MAAAAAAPGTPPKAAPFLAPRAHRSIHQGSGVSLSVLGTNTRPPAIPTNRAARAGS